VLNRQQKEAGTLVLDIGAGTTNMVIVEDGEVYHVAVIPVGGIHITNDLAIGLKTDLDVAEIVKTEHATLEPSSGFKTVKLTHEGNNYIFQSEEVADITEARVEELLELVDKELKKVHRSRKLPGGVVMVGGTSKLPGIALFTREKLQLASRVGELQPLAGLIDSVQNSSYATAVGLMVLDMLLLPSTPLSKGHPSDNAFGIIEGLLRRVKKRAR